MPSDFSKLMHLPLVTSVTPAKPCSSAEAPAEGPWVSQWERQEHSLQGESTALPVVCTPGPGIFRWLMCWAPRFAQQLPSSARTESEFGGGGSVSQWPLPASLWEASRVWEPSGVCRALSRCGRSGSHRTL